MEEAPWPVQTLTVLLDDPGDLPPVTLASQHVVAVHAWRDGPTTVLTFADELGPGSVGSGSAELRTGQDGGGWTRHGLKNHATRSQVRRPYEL